MLSISNLSYNIGSRPIFTNAQLHIKPKDKIGLIGLNGTGKTTLLKIINGEITPDEGEISRNNQCTIGYLNQDLLSFQSSESILSVAMEAFEEAMKLEIRIEKLIQIIETDHSEKNLEKLSKLQEKYEALGGYSIQSKAEEILEGVGFKTSDLHRPLEEFSGGWKMRVMLARLLLERPSILMLDEPTNHLDLPSIQWVENYLKNYEGAIVVVSHDKFFLDNTVNKIIEVKNLKLNLFQGNYSFYLEEKTLRDEIQKNAFQNQQQKIKQTEQFISRFRAKATKARQVQSRIKSLERMDIVDDIVDGDTSVHFKFGFKQQSGRHVVITEHLSKHYGDIEVLQDTNLSIERGDKIALIGANGIGKSTMLRIIDNKEPYSGDVRHGHNVHSSFYAQHQIEALNIENEILDELKQSGTDKNEQELRQILGCFLFSGDDVFKKIKVLSGGEKSRVALAKTLISEANFLLLDEPTNHLDIVSVNILIQALQQYQGTFIVVSHDRHFISEIANKIWYVSDKIIKEYPGTYEEYLYWTDQNATAPTTEPIKKEKPKKEKNKNNTRSDSQTAALKKQLREIEERIEHLETAIQESENKLALPEIYGDPDRLLEVNTIYEKQKKDLDQQNQEWESIVDKLENT